MSKFSTHRAILELWKAVPVTGNQSWMYALANDLCRVLPVKVTYYTVRRWWERDSIPVQFHSGLVEAAAARKFSGVTYKTLADIKGHELHLRLVPSSDLPQRAGAC